MNVMPLTLVVTLTKTGCFIKSAYINEFDNSLHNACCLRNRI